MTTSKQGRELETIDLLKDLLIVQLLQAGVPQQEVRTIVRCGIERVNTIGKALKGRQK